MLFVLAELVKYEWNSVVRVVAKVMLDGRCTPTLKPVKSPNWRTFIV